MAWTTTSDVSAGSVLTATDYNGQVLGNLNAIRGDFGLYRYTSGDVTLTGTTSWSNLTTIGTSGDITLAASAGDVVEASVFALFGTQAVDAGLDVVTVVSSTRTNSLSTGGAVPANWTAFNTSGWYKPGGSLQGISGSLFYVLQAGDISSSTVTLRVQYAMVTTTNRTLYGNTANPFIFAARNHGPVQA